MNTKRINVFKFKRLIIKVFSLFTLLFIIITGCASKPTPFAFTTQVPEERRFAFKQPKSSDSGKIVVIRDSGLLGGGCYYGLWIDGTFAARLNPGERSEFYLSAGEHVLRSGRRPPWSRIVCP